MNRRHHAARLPALTFSLALALAGCGDKVKDAKPGQALASVNGEEITVLQLNEELQRAGVSAAQQQAAGKHLLQVLIDRQLLQSEAAREKLDRDPKVLQAVERAKALIVAQAYLQKRIGNVARPTATEVEDYFNQHPQFFSHRKQFAMNELILPARELTPEVRAAVDGAASLEEVATWLDARKIAYARGQVTRSTSDLSPQVSAKLLEMRKGQLFIVKEGERAMLLAVTEVREAPVTLKVASQQIEQFLANKRSKDMATAELARLRAAARIEYIDKSMAIEPAAAPRAGGDAAAAVAPDPAPAAGEADKAALERGVAGLK